MADVKWTDSQKQVLDHRGSSLLVSAAAGSGKTAVLVERVIQRICDPNERADIDRFLIVTFTAAAAAEMKAKIYAAITDRLSKDPSNRRLRKQLGLLQHAQINTVHGFCQSLLREHFEMLSLSPDFRIADELESDAMKAAALNELIETAYAEANPAFHALVDALSAARDDRRMVEVIKETYEKLRSHPFPAVWETETLLELERACHLEPTETIYGKVLLSEAQESLLSVKTAYVSAIEHMREDPSLSKGYLPAFEADFAAMELLETQLCTGTWDTITAFFSELRFIALKSSPKCDKQVLNSLKALRERWKDLVKELQEKYFTVTAVEAQADFRQTLPLARTLFELVDRFEKAYSATKRRRNVLDFSDLEHFSIALLVRESRNGVITPTSLAEEISCRYTEIMVDEYQDTNEVQDSIFKAISQKESNLFMVGDIKQSIYGFRLADPMIFLNKYKTFSDTPAAGKPRKIVLSRNFRSRMEVLDSINFIFRVVMSNAFGDLDYTPTEYLYHGKDYPDTTMDISTELLITETGDAETPGVQLEAASVAKRIRRMIDGCDQITDRKTGTLRPVEYGDIVILLRSQSGKAIEYTNILQQYGIPCRSDTSEPLLETVECSTVLAFLSVIDNTANDITLTAVMRSPMYRFTTDELAVIRTVSKHTPYSDAVSAYAESGEQQDIQKKCQQLLADIDTLRIRAGNMTVGRLLWHLYDSMQLLTRYGAYPNGAQKQTNLIALFDLARKFEQMGYKGLYAFIRFIDRLRDSGGSGKIAVPKITNEKAVTIMSIHKSKGLEFPVVILPDCSKTINLQDLRETLLIHSNLGVGFKAREATRHIEYPTLARLAIGCRSRREILSEELRILYVAMTRAKEKLILSAHVKDYTAYTEKLSASLSYTELSPSILRSENCILPWILYPLLGSRGTPVDSDSGIFWRIEVIPHSDAESAAEQPTAASDRSKFVPTYEETDLHIKTFVYPHAEAANLPSKITATGLKGRVFDTETNADAVSIPLNAQPRHPKKPRFLLETSMSATERGIAHHLVMQFMDFTKTDSIASVRAEILRLFAHGFLTKAQADAVDPAKILAFFQSSLGQMLCGADQVYRELKFSLLAAPKTIGAIVAGKTPDPIFESVDSTDKLLLQGVIDCYFEKDDVLTLIDFKTDLLAPGTEQLAAERYRPQLASYAYALERITGKPVTQTYLYLFHTNTALRL